MKKIIFPFLLLIHSLLLLSSCNLGGADPETNFWFTTRLHAPLFIQMNLTCPYDSTCRSQISFGPNFGGEVRVYLGDSYYPHNYEYTFVSDSVSETVSVNSTIPLQIHDDDHVYFSLIDSTGAEKSYDIDLSGMIHSWTRRGDSVDIILPEYIDDMGIYEREENQAQQVCWFYGDSLPERTVTISYEEKWDDEYDLAGGLSGQSSYGTDSVRILGYIYWRPDSL